MLESKLTIAHIGQMGQGVGTDPEGNIYFVPGAIPGDVVRVRYAPTPKRYRDAELIELIGPSSDRQASPCAYFPTCGGCDWLHWDYSAQLRAKEEIVRHTMSRNGLEPVNFRPVRPAEKLSGYRNRVQVRREGGRLGFHRKRSHEVVDVANCWVADPRLNDELAALRAETPATAEKTKYEIYVRRDGSVARVENREHAVDGFAQVNDSQNEAMKEIVARHLTERGSRNVLELFAGNGNLTFSFPKMEKVIAIDSSSPAIEMAKKHRDEIGAKQLVFLENPVDRRLPGRLPPDFKKAYDTIVLDPPRSGVGMDLRALIHGGVKTIIYVSCAPVTFAQDVQVLKDDFILDELEPVDMFPHTRHIELVSRWIRRDS